MESRFTCNITGIYHRRVIQAKLFEGSYERLQNGNEEQTYEKHNVPPVRRTMINLFIQIQGSEYVQSHCNKCLLSKDANYKPDDILNVKLA